MSCFLPGWKKVVEKARNEGDEIMDDPGAAWQMPRQILLVFVGAMVIYSALFSIGGFVYGDLMQGFILGSISAVGIYILFKLMSKLKLD